MLREAMAFESAKQQLEFFICENQELRQKCEDQLWGW